MILITMKHKMILQQAQTMMMMMTGPSVNSAQIATGRILSINVISSTLTSLSLKERSVEVNYF